MQHSVQHTVDRLLGLPETVSRFDLDGDGVLSEEEMEFLRRVVRGELEKTSFGDELVFTDGYYEERFRLLGRLGSGGQADVFLARDEETERAVVVKRVELTALHDWKTLELFEREAEVLAGLDHPGIPAFVTKFRIGEPATGLGIVQDFVPGTTMYEYLYENGAYSEDALYNLANQLFDILAYIHNQSPPVVHRDIKPSNLIVDDSFVCHLIDFGAARDLPSATAGGSTIVGTHGYMPMEQYMGIAKPTTDLYATGVTLLHALTGLEPSEFPFEENRLQFEKHVTKTSPFFPLFKALLEPVAERRLDSAKNAKKMLRTDTQALIRTEAPTPMPLRVPDLDREFPTWLEVDVDGQALTFEVQSARKFRVKEVDGGVIVLRGASNAHIRRLMGLGMSVILAIAAVATVSISGFVAAFLSVSAVFVWYYAMDRDGYVRIDYLGVNVPGVGVFPFTNCNRFEARGSQIFLHFDDVVNGERETEIHVPIADREHAFFVVERLNRSLAIFRERVGLKRFVEA